MSQFPKLYQFLTLNDNYSSFFNFFTEVKKRINVDGYELEVDKKMSSRILLKQINNSISEDYSHLREMVIKTSIDSQILRSRFTYIRNDCFKYLKKLDDLMVNVKRLLSIEYKSQLEQVGIKTQIDKGSIIDSLFIEVERFLTELRILIDTLEFSIKDIDQGGYSTNNLVKLLELSIKYPHI